MEFETDFEQSSQSRTHVCRLVTSSIVSFSGLSDAGRPHAMRTQIGTPLLQVCLQPLIGAVAGTTSNPAIEQGGCPGGVRELVEKHGSGR